MNTAHEKLVEKAIEAITRVFSDTSVSPETTIESLNSIICETEIMVSAVSVADTE